ncbi:hypothetical protein PGB90_008632 [Kerria lacca]
MAQVFVGENWSPRAAAQVSSLFTSNWRTSCPRPGVLQQWKRIKSSANNAYWTGGWIRWRRLSVAIRKSSGLRIDPWGTPLERGFFVDSLPLTFTEKVLS